MTGGSRRWLGLVALTLGVAMIIVDATIVNVAIPSIVRDLGIGITQAEWANSIYSLVFAALLISVGRVGDVGGRRRVFVLGLVVFPLMMLHDPPTQRYVENRNLAAGG